MRPEVTRQQSIAKREEKNSQIWALQPSTRKASHTVSRSQSSFLFFYNLLLTVALLPTLPLVGLALLLRPRYRLGLGQRLGFLSAAVRQRAAGHAPLWLHAPSVGEVLATRPFLRALKKTFPTQPLLLSVLTPTAYATVQTKLPEADAVMYFPLDYPLVVNKVVNHIRPAAFFFTETEVWPNCLSALVRRGVPTFLVSGRFSTRAVVRYRVLDPVFRPLFQNLTLCCMQTRNDAERLIAAGAPRKQVLVTGNFKVDGIIQGGEQGRAILEQAGLIDRPLVVGASTHQGEEAMLLEAYRNLRTTVPSLLLLLAPRHPQRFVEVERLLETGGYRYCKRSQLPEAQPTEIDVFLLDTVGELTSFYPGAALAFVGGSLVKGPGGHSVIEPALARVPVAFGPHTRNFTTIVEELKRAGGGIEVRDVESFCQQIRPLLSDVRARQEAGRRAYEVIWREQGAVERTLAAVLKAIQNTDGTIMG